MGSVRVRVSAQGFKPKEITVRIEPGKFCPAKVVLERVAE
jgi:hypothetical protein